MFQPNAGNHRARKGRLTPPGHCRMANSVHGARRPVRSSASSCKTLTILSWSERRRCSPMEASGQCCSSICRGTKKASEGLYCGLLFQPPLARVDGRQLVDFAAPGRAGRALAEHAEMVTLAISKRYPADKVLIRVLHLVRAGSGDSAPCPLRNSWHCS